MTEETFESLQIKSQVENLLIEGERAKKIIIYIYNNKLEKFDIAILEKIGIEANLSSNYKVLARLERLGIIKKFKIGLYNKNLYEIINKEKLEELVKKIAEKI